MPSVCRPPHRYSRRHHRKRRPTLPPGPTASPTDAATRARPAAARAPDTAPKHVPGTRKTMTMAHIRDYWDVGDWFPDEHPPMPDRRRSRTPAACARLRDVPHARWQGTSRERAGGGPSAALHRAAAPGLQARAPQQRRPAQDQHGPDDRSGEGHDRRRDEGRGDVFLVDAVDASGLRSARRRPCPRRARTATCSSRCRATRPNRIGNRIIESPEDKDRFELRDPQSGFIAYVPPGSVDRRIAARRRRRQQDDPLRPVPRTGPDGPRSVPASPDGRRATWCDNCGTSSRARARASGRR